MKILVVIGAYFPAMNFGGPVISIENLCKQLHKDIDFYVLTLDHDLKSFERLVGIKEGWNDIGYGKVRYLREKEVNYHNLYEITKEINPNLIYLNNFFWAQFTIPFLRIAKKTKRQLIIAPRGEFFDNALNKKYKKMPYTLLIRKFFIRNNIYFHATSKAEALQFKRYIKVNDNNIFTLQNMATLCVGNESYNILDRKKLKVVYLARIHKSKNLLYALDVLSAIPFKVQFNIYGNIEDRLYWRECETRIKSLRDNIEVHYVGIAKRNEIENIFASHHVFLFPTITENFGHSIAESLLSGCPVITSNNTPWNWIQKEKCGYALPLDDRNAYIHAIYHIFEMTDNEYQFVRRSCKSEATKNLKATELAKEYKNIFDKIAEGGRE